MKKKDKIVPENTFLRSKAEKLLNGNPVKNNSHPLDADIIRLVHELQVHQIELELQNEELKRAKDEAETASQKYTELYDFAPSGFFTLSNTGVIVELNLRGAQMLGKPRSYLINSIFTFFVTADTKSIFNLFLQNIFNKQTLQNCEVTLITDNQEPAYVYLKGIISNNGEQCIINAFDITKRKQIEEALRKSEETNRRILLKTTLDGFWLVNRQGKILEVNDVYCRMSGYAEQELLYRNISELEALETDIEVITHIQKIVEKGSDVFESRHRRKDGSIFDVEVSVNYHALDGGQMVAFIRDITERKRGEELLTFQSNLLSEVNDAVFSSDSNFRITYWNQAAEKLFGWTKEEALGKNSDELLKPKPEVLSLEEIRSNLQNNGNCAGVGQYLRKDGTYFFVEVNSKTLNDADGKYNGQLIVARDITERKKAEDAITASEKEFRLLTESMPQIVWTTAADGQNTYFNHQWMEYTGLTLEESYGHGWNKPFHPDDQQRAWDAWQNAVQYNADYMLQCRLRRFDGVYRWWLIHGVPVIDNNGTITKWYGTCTDIDEMKNAGDTILHNEKLLRSVIDNVSSGVALIDETGQFIVYNPVFLKLFGLSPDSTIKNVNDQDWSQWQVFDENKNRLHVDIHPVRKEALTGKLVKNQLVAMKLPSGGDYIWMLISAEPVQKEDGSIDKIICTYHDITELKQAEQLVIESEQRYRTLFEFNNDAIFLVDMEFGSYVDCNHLAEKLTGYSRNEILALKTGDLLAPRRKQEAASNIEQLVSHNILRRETEIITKDGHIIPVEFNASVIEINKKRFILSMLHDISKRKAAMEALKQSEERVKFKLKSILSPEGSIADLELHDIIDTKTIQDLMEHFYELAKVPMSITDLSGKALIEVGRQDICSKFHRANPKSCRNCYDSDFHLTHAVIDGEFKFYKCKNNMWELATPLFIGGEHKGSLFMGQFFFDSEPFNINLFRKQAGRYNFEMREYLEAVEKVPHLSLQKVEHAKSFLLNLARSISQLSYSNIKLSRAIAQQKYVEEKLKENDLRLNKAQEIAHLGSWSLDLDKNILSWSDEMYRIFDVLPGEFQGTYEGFLESVYPDDRDAVNAAYTGSILEGRDSYEIEHRIIRKHTAELRYILEKCEHERDATGKIIRSVGLSHDLTELKKSEEALRENERLFRESQAAGHIASFSVDLVQKTWKATPAIFGIFGIDETYPNTLDSWFQLIHPDFKEKIYNDLFYSENKLNTLEHEYKVIRVNDGEEVWVYKLGKVVYDNQQNPVSVIGTIQDITKRKQAEEALKKLNEELENRVRERTEELLNVTFDVEERERNRFSLELHDDLGPLLSSVKLYFQWLAATENPEKKKIITGKGNDSIERAIQTTREISHGLGSQVVKNIGYIRAVQDFVQSINDTQKLYIGFKFNSNKKLSNFLEITLYRITTELINNTLKYAGATRVEIDFDYKRTENFIIFTYTDNGIGFDLVKTEKTSKGLGLMNIKNRINLLSGIISIDTGIGKGLYVFIKLPVDDERLSNDALN